MNLLLPRSDAPVFKVHAGPCKVEAKGAGRFLVTPLKKRGQIQIVKIDSLLHFQWKDRTTMTVDSACDAMVFPGDAQLVAAATGRDGERVYVLQFEQNPSRRFFFWLQDKDSAEDEDQILKFNAAMNGASVASASSGADAEEAGSMAALLRQLQSEGGSAPSTAGPTLLDLQSVMQNLNVPAPADAAAAAAVAADATMTEAATAPAATGGLSSEDLQRAMAGAMSNFGPRATLGDVANGEEIVASGVFDDEAVCTALLALLPEGQRTREELHSIVRAPQFRQVLAQLTNALQTPDNYNSLFANFGLDPSAAPLGADAVTAFLAAVAQAAPATPATQPADAPAESDDAPMDESES